MTSDRILVVNVGSSSLKLSVVEPDGTVGPTTDVDCPDEIPAGAVDEFAREVGPVAGVGHRIVHGGAEFSEAARLAPAVRERIVALAPLAPLHQGRAVAGIDAVTAALPDLPAVA